jgi:hypothetical protein
MIKRLFNSFKTPDVLPETARIQELLALGYTDGTPLLSRYLKTIGMHTLGVLAQSKDIMVSRAANVAIVARLTGREL